MFIIAMGALQQGLIYSLVAVALYISFRTLNIADMTTDGAFTMGAALSAVITAAGHPWLALPAAAAGGVLAGGVTALLQTKLKIAPILAGIITMTGLYTVNLLIMHNSSNISLLREQTVFTAAYNALGEWGVAGLLAGIVLAVCAALALFLRTQLGLSLRATGDNRDMVSASSVNPAFTTAVGLCLANGITGLSGALTAQLMHGSDINLGTGMVMIGLASLIIGEVIFGRRSVARGLMGAVCGSVIYRAVIAVALYSAGAGGTVYMRLISAAVVTVAISYPVIQEKLRLHKRRKEGNRHA